MNISAGQKLPPPRQIRNYRKPKFINPIDIKKECREKWKRFSNYLTHAKTSSSLQQMHKLFKKRKHASLKQKWRQIMKKLKINYILAQKDNYKKKTENDNNRITHFSRWKKPKIDENQPQKREDSKQVIPKQISNNIPKVGRFQKKFQTPNKGSPSTFLNNNKNGNKFSKSANIGRINPIRNPKKPTMPPKKIQSRGIQAISKFQMQLSGNSPQKRTSTYIRNQWKTFKKKIYLLKTREMLRMSQKIDRHRMKWHILREKALRNSFNKISVKMKKAIFNEIITFVNELLVHHHLTPARHISLTPCYHNLENSSVLGVLSLFTKQLFFREKIHRININIGCLDFSKVKTISSQRMRRIIQYIVDYLLFPYTNSKIDRETTNIIIGALGIEESLQLLPKKEITHLNNLSPIDMRIYINDRMIYDIVNSVYDQIQQPLCQNDIDSKSLECLTKDIDFTNVLPSLDTYDINSIFNLIQHDDRYYSSWELIYDVINDLYNHLGFPLQRNNVTLAICKEIVKNDQFDSVDMFSFMPIHHLLHMTVRDDKTYSLYSIADYIANAIIEETQFPIIPNLPNYETLNEILNEFDFLTVNDFSTQDIEKLLNLTNADMKKYVNNIWADYISEEILDDINFPIIPNSFSNEDIQIIAEMPLEDSFDILDIPPPYPIIHFQVIDTQLYVNDVIADDIVHDIYSETYIPLTSNLVTQKDIDDITETDYDDVTQMFSNIDINKLLNINPYERRIIIDKHLAKIESLNVINYGFASIPIIPNDISDEDSRYLAISQEIFKAFDFFKMDDAKFLDPMSCIDMQYYVNGRNIEALSNKIENEIKIPIVSNAVTPEIIHSICQLPIEDSLLSLKFDSFQIIDRYVPKDMKYYVNKNIIENILSILYNKTKIPIISNLVSKRDINEILEEEKYENEVIPFSKFDIDKLLYLNPYERRIDFNFPITVRQLFNTTPFPIVLNDITPKAEKQILDMFNDIEYYNYEINGLSILQRYEAPPEIIYNLDDFIEKYQMKILNNEIFPSLPFSRFYIIKDDVSKAITSVLIDNRRVLKQVVNVSIDSLKNIHPTYIPIVLSPDDVVNYILWNGILDEIPLIPNRWAYDAANGGFLDDIEENVLDNFNNNIFSSQILLSEGSETANLLKSNSHLLSDSTETSSLSHFTSNDPSLIYLHDNRYEEEEEVSHIFTNNILVSNDASLLSNDDNNHPNNESSYSVNHSKENNDDNHLSNESNYNINDSKENKESSSNYNINIASTDNVHDNDNNTNANVNISNININDISENIGNNESFIIHNYESNDNQFENENMEEDYEGSFETDENSKEYNNTNDNIDDINTISSIDQVSNTQLSKLNISSDDSPPSISNNEISHYNEYTVNYANEGVFQSEPSTFGETGEDVMVYAPRASYTEIENPEEEEEEEEDQQFIQNINQEGDNSLFFSPD